MSERRRTRSVSLVISLFLFASAPASAQQPEPAADQPADQAPGEPPDVDAAQPEQPEAPEAAISPAPTPEVKPETFPAMGPSNELRLGENFFLRPGVMLQSWTEVLQDRVEQENGDPGEYQMNSYLRRARLFFGGGLFKKITFLVLFEAANLGRATTSAEGATSKSFNTLLFQDALASFNFHPAFTVQAGLMLVPFTRNILQSTATYLTLDIMTTSATYIAATQTSTLRDTGLQIKGQMLEDHFEYRLGVFQGIRQSPSQMGTQGGKNPFRVAGYLQYNFLDPEVGYVFNGQYFGHKNVLGIAAGFDYQKLDGNDVDAYLAFSASAFGSYRLNGDAKAGGDEIAGIVQFLRFDPGTSLAPPPAPGGVAEQTDLGAELSYYNKAAKLSVFGKFEMRTHSDDVFEAANLQIFGGGLKYFLAESAANATLAYNRIDTPDAGDGVNPVNQVVLQLQLAYY